MENRKDLDKFATNLRDYSEKKINNKYNSKRKKDVNKLKQMISPKLPYQKKASDLQYAVENTIYYFESKQLFETSK